MQSDKIYEVSETQLQHLKMHITDAKQTIPSLPVAVSQDEKHSRNKLVSMLRMMETWIEDIEQFPIPIPS